MGKKGGAVLGKNLARTQQKSKKVIRGEKQEGFLHTTDLQVIKKILPFLFFYRLLTTDCIGWIRLGKIEFTISYRGRQLPRFP